MLPLGWVENCITGPAKSAMSKSGDVIWASPSRVRRSTSQLVLASMPFCTCGATFTTSKLGWPEANSSTLFCRNCCSGTCSADTLMPVNSSNSRWLASSMSPRGFFDRYTPSVCPL